MASYQLKKKQCEKRMIDFDFTEQEWEDFNNLKNTVKCAYTNVEFSDKEGHPYYPTVERIDDTKGYSPENCVHVSLRANQLKAHYIEDNADRSKLEVGDAGLLKRIERIVSSVENIKAIQEPYKHLFRKEQKETNMIDEIKENVETSPELRLCKAFLLFGEYVENNLKCKLGVSFAEFKRLMSKKKCALTGKDFNNEITPLFYVKDVSLDEITKNDVLIVEKSIALGLNSLLKNTTLSSVEFNNMIKTLGGKL